MGFFLEDESRIQGLAASFVRTAEQMRTFVLQHPNAPLAYQAILDTVFLDSGTIQQPGGSGQVFDWQKAVPLVEGVRNHFNVVVAGGLNPNNVAESINVLHPWGVDVCSGVEARPGKKDPEKIQAFVAAVRAAEKSS
jgi:phosphoribosylanthranilate isomerase